MTGFTITNEDVIRELKIWIILLLGSIGINLYAIILHNGAWSELYTQFHVVLLISVMLYMLLAIIRAAVFGVNTLIKKFKVQNSDQNTE